MICEDGYELLRAIGPVRRARDYRLYTQNGKRLLDLCQDGGLAILGHRSPRLTLAFKNALERGVTTALPSVYLERLETAVRRLVPEAICIRVYRNLDRACAVLSAWLDRPITLPDIADPVLTARGDTWFWRPFLPSERLLPVVRALSGVEGGVVLPVLPSLGESPPQVVLFGKEGAPPSDLVAPMRLAALVRGVYDLAAAMEPAPLALPGFRHVGPYLVPSTDGEQYRRRFERFLEEGILLSPCASIPSILPAVRSRGEEALLGRVAAYAVQSEASNNGH